jgi:hypothetical protein
MLNVLRRMALLCPSASVALAAGAPRSSTDQRMRIERDGAFEGDEFVGHVDILSTSQKLDLA